MYIPPVEYILVEGFYQEEYFDSTLKANGLRACVYIYVCVCVNTTRYSTTPLLDRTKKERILRVFSHLYK